ncbi:hypothetical protein KAU08_09935 [bacterium]|nr:hypothetical protein [bacterium]
MARNNNYRLILILIISMFSMFSCENFDDDSQTTSQPEIEETDITGFGNIILGAGHDTIDTSIYEYADEVARAESFIGLRELLLETTDLLMDIDPSYEVPEILSEDSVEGSLEALEEIIEAARQNAEDGNLKFNTVEGFVTEAGSTDVSVTIKTEQFSIITIDLKYMESDSPEWHYIDIPEMSYFTQTPLEEYLWAIQDVRSMLLDKYDESQIIRDEFEDPEGIYLEKVMEIIDSDGDSIWLGHLPSELYEETFAFHVIYRYRETDDDSSVEEQIENL